MSRIWFISFVQLLIAQISAKFSLLEKRDILIDRYLNKNDQPFTLELNRREQILETSRTRFGEFPQAMKGRLLVKFEGDRTTDNMNGALEEYLSLLSNDLLDPDYKLFSPRHPSYKDGRKRFGFTLLTLGLPISELHIVFFNPLILDMDHVNRLRHVGNVIGMAILNKQVMHITFQAVTYEMILIKKFPNFKVSQKSPCHEKATDLPSEMHKSMKLSISVDKPTGRTFQMNYFSHEGFTLTFTDDTYYGDMKMVNWFNENEDFFSEAVLCQGIFEIIPHEAFTELEFSMNEIKTLISGEMRTLRIEDWQRLVSPGGHWDKYISSIYKFGCPKTLRWFTEMEYVTDQYTQYHILLYITGNSCLPVGLLDGGLDASKPYINIEWSGETNTPPTSDPKTNTLRLSSYTSEAKMKDHFKEILNKMSGAPLCYEPSAVIWQSHRD